MTTSVVGSCIMAALLNVIFLSDVHKPHGP